ncbi:MAG: NAD(+) synthase [Planctomycetes bacterium]|nr:NAD(+) synthase [Planctomycetota bacterium]
MRERERFSAAVLALDPAAEVARIAAAVRRQLAGELKRRGLVVALSGGVDSSVVAALCVEAIGRDRVFGLRLPERESSSATRELGRRIGDHLGIAALEEDITPVLESVGCYRRRDAAIRTVIPEYGPGYACKLVLPAGPTEPGLRLFSLVVSCPGGEVVERRLPHEAYLEVVAASNFKQRVRKMLEYHHAERLHYAVAGTSNRLEYDQGFFVKGGDGAADLKPIAHLYKTQVYQLAEHLGLPEAIRRQVPTTDTYPMAQTQEEFYFSLPWSAMDLCLYGVNHQVPAGDVAAAMGLEEERVQRVYRDIEQKRRTTRYLHLSPRLVEAVSEVEPRR